MWIDRIPKSSPVPIPWIDISFFMGGFAILPAVFGFYTFYTILFTQYLKPKRKFHFFLGLIILTLCCGMIGVINVTVLHYFHLSPGLFAAGLDSAIPITIIICINGLLNGGMGLVSRGFVSWYNDIRLKEDLYKKNLEIELALVKSQINPHFLFNTINNIDVLIEKDQVLASLYLNKLSDIMRYMLYETKSEKVEVAKEIAYVEKYIELQKIRTPNKNFVTCKLEIFEEDWQIAPMLFIPFIENAFKHAEHLKSGSAIEITIKASADRLLFRCSNKYTVHKKHDQDAGGLGNDLILKRIKLLYPDKHDLEIEDLDSTYTVTLILYRNAN
jgi:hypothetical protein